MAVDEYLDTQGVSWWLESIDLIGSTLVGAAGRLLEGIMQAVAPDTAAETEISIAEPAGSRGLIELDEVDGSGTTPQQLAREDKLRFFFSTWGKKMMSQTPAKDWMREVHKLLKEFTDRKVEVPAEIAADLSEWISTEQAWATLDWRESAPTEPARILTTLNSIPRLLPGGNRDQFQEMDYYQEPGKLPISNPTPAQKAMMEIRVNWRYLKQDIVNRVYAMLDGVTLELPVELTWEESTGPEYRGQETRSVQLSENERIEVANVVADEYIRAVWEFLRSNPRAKPATGTRHWWEGQAAPWCADWFAGIGRSLHDSSSKTLRIAGQAVLLGDIVFFETLQRNGPPRFWHPHQTMQHNFVVACPTPYKGSIQLAPKKDPVILIFDPWVDMLPRVYTTDNHVLPTYKGMMGRMEQFKRAMYYWRMQPDNQEQWRQDGFPDRFPPPRPLESPYTPPIIFRRRDY